MDFILINLAYNPSTAVLDWADAILKANSGRRAIVESHSILNTDNSWSNQSVYTALRDNPNLFLMLCGHMQLANDGAAYRSEVGDDWTYNTYNGGRLSELSKRRQRLPSYFEIFTFG